MKLLMEKWRQYLNERKTDELYSRLVDFFVDVYSDHRNFKYESEEEERKYEGNPLDRERAMARLDKFFNTEDEDGETFIDRNPHIFQKIDPNKPKNYSLYFIEPRRHEVVEKIKEIDPRGELISQNIDWEGFWLPSIEIKFDKESGAMGTWNVGDKELTLYFNSFMDEETYKQISGADDIREIMKVSNYKSLLRRVLDHELTHFINSVRADGEGDGTPMSRDYWKTKRGKEIFQYIKDNFPGWESWKDGGWPIESRVKYINSTEEIQARLIPIFKLVQNFVHSSEEVDMDTDTDDLNRVRAELEKRSPNIRNIIKHIKNIYDFQHPHYWELTIKPLQNKILQRIYQFALQLIEDTK